MKKFEDRLKMSEVMLQSDKHDIRLLFGQFLDDFYRAGDRQFELIKDEPPYKKIKDDRRTTEEWLCTLAATAHRLANEYELTVPHWVFSEKYIAKQKLYGANTQIKEYQQFLEETSLPEFAQRNLFLGDNVLSRC